MNEDELRGKYLAKLRIEKNLKQSVLAKMLGYSDKSISKWERGKCFPKDTKTLIKLADILDVSIDDLLHAEFSDIEGKNTPYLKNKFLNFIFKNRIIFIIVFVLIILLFLSYYIFVIDFKSSNKRTYLHTDEVEKIDEESLENINLKISDDNSIENINDVANEKIKYDRNKIDNILINEGFIYNQNFYFKKMDCYSEIYFFMENYTFKIYDYSDENDLYLLFNSRSSNVVTVEKYINENHEIEYIKTSEIKNCNLEKCETYLDYAMYINYIKKLILE